MVNLLRMASGEKVAAVLPIREFTDGNFIVFATEQGYIKKTDLMSFATPRPSGLIALTIDEEDKLIRVDQTNGSDEVLIGTRMGQAIRFSEADVRPMGRTARGVRAIKLKKDGDAVVGMVIVRESEPFVLTVCEKGYGKRTAFSEFRLQSRSGSGIINCNVTEKTGAVAGVTGVANEDQIMAITSGGIMLRTTVDQISVQGRSTQGVRIINAGQDEVVTSIARIVDPATATVEVSESPSEESTAEPQPKD